MSSTYPVFNNNYTWTYLKVMHGHHLAVSFSFFFLPLTLFEAIFEKLAYCQSWSGHRHRKGHPRRAWKVECVFLFLLFFFGGGHHRNFFGAIKYTSCSACFVIYMHKRCLTFLY